MVRLIVGLGNPGKHYEKTRHNVGFSLLDLFAENYQHSFSSGNFQADELIVKFNDVKTIFLKPLTYMNLSGNAVRSYLKYYNIVLNDLLIVHDELDLLIGNFKLKRNGQSGGHNGIKSIINQLHTTEFSRLKIGITNRFKRKGKDFALSQFIRSDLVSLNIILPTLLKIIYLFAKGITLDNLMLKFHTNKSD